MAAAEDLHHAIQFGFPAEYRVQLSLCRPAGQVPAVFIAGTAAPRCGRGCPGLQRQDQLPGHLAALPHSLIQLHPHSAQHQPCCTAIIFQHRTEQMLRLCPGKMRILRTDQRIIHRPLQLRRHRRTVQPVGGAAAFLRELTTHRLLGDLFTCQKAGRRAAGLLQHRQQKMRGIRPVTAQAPCQLHRFVQKAPRLPGKAPVSVIAESIK